MSIIDYIGSLPIPESAFLVDTNINAGFLETYIPGFRTTSVSGLHAWDRSVSEVDSDIQGGSLFRRVKDSTREVTVSFNITTDTTNEFDRSWNLLKEKLYEQDELKFYFGSDISNRDHMSAMEWTDSVKYRVRYIKGSVTSISEDPIEVDYNGVRTMNGSYIIHLSSPYIYTKYAPVIPVVNSNTAKDGQIGYESLYYASYKELLTITFNVNSDMDGVAIIDSKGHTIQVGDPTAALGSSNRFHKGDTIIVDIDAKTINVNGIDRPDLGDIANEWDNFLVNSNSNNAITIKMTTGAYPKITIDILGVER